MTTRDPITLAALADRMTDDVELGDMVGRLQDPTVRFGRVVGLRRDRSGPWIMVRKFRDDTDEHWQWPTGEVEAFWLVMPWEEQPIRGVSAP